MKRVDKSMGTKCQVRKKRICSDYSGNSPAQILEGKKKEITSTGKGGKSIWKGTGRGEGDLAGEFCFLFL